MKLTRRFYTKDGTISFYIMYFINIIHCKISNNFFKNNIEKRVKFSFEKKYNLPRSCFDLEISTNSTSTYLFIL